jgi:hypothetical protein
MRLPRLRRKKKTVENGGKSEPAIKELEDTPWDKKEHTELEDTPWDEKEHTELEDTPWDEKEHTEVEFSDVLVSQAADKKDPIKGKEYLVSQFSLNHEEKKVAEQEVFSDTGKIREKEWEKTARENLDEIEQRIDGGLEGVSVQQDTVREEEEKVLEKTEVDIMPTDAERVYGNIISKEVIYETPGGYVVKVSYLENDDIKTSYYSVSRVDGIEFSLDEIKAYKPIVTQRTEKITETPRVEKEKGKNLLNRLWGKK